MRNTIGVAFYMTALTQLRTRMASSPSFAALYKQPRTNTANLSVLPTLTSTGNLISGATTRLSVGFVLNPLSIIKVRYEVRCLSNVSADLIINYRATCTPTKVFSAHLYLLFDRALASYSEVTWLRHCVMLRMLVFLSCSMKGSNMKFVSLSLPLNSYD